MLSSANLGRLDIAQAFVDHNEYGANHEALVDILYTAQLSDVFPG